LNEIAASLGCAWEMAITHRTNLLAKNAEGPGLVSSGYLDLKLVGLEVCIPQPPTSTAATRDVRFGEPDRSTLSCRARSALRKGEKREKAVFG
jgi:hypothetical protein